VRYIYKTKEEALQKIEIYKTHLGIEESKKVKKQHMFNTKKRKLKKLNEFLDNLNNQINWPDGYLETHTNRIDCLNWLVSYYEGRAAVTPQRMFEILIGVPNPTITDCHWATTLWYWIYKDEIYGF
jgi:hypothetical protein